MLNRFKYILCNNALIENTIEVCKQPELLRTIRWRKRRWAPVSAKKAFYVRKPTPRIPEETEELRWRYNNYRTTMRAIREFVKNDLHRPEEEKMVETPEEVTEFEALCQDLLLWNQESAMFRESREQITQQAAREERRREIEEVERERQEQQEKAAQLLSQKEEEAKTFVDVNNLEEEIAQALNMRVNHNFAIDTHGTRYIELADGSVKPEEREDKKEESAHSQ